MNGQFPELAALVRCVQENHGSESIVVLFGSRARGDQDEWSDYDVLVIADFDGRSSPETKIYRSVKGLHLDLVCLTAAEYRARIEAFADGTPAPPTADQETSAAQVTMAISALDGVCLSGAATFEPFRQLRARWIEEGRIPDPILNQYPSIDDGFVPTQRALVAFLPTEKYRKSAAVVTKASSSTNVAGASFLYRILIAMTQRMVSRYPLIDGQGNFGSVGGFPAAAMRYTECRSSRLLVWTRQGEESEYLSPEQIRDAAEMLSGLAIREDVTADEVTRAVKQSIRKSTSRENPPRRFPNLLANGTLGIPSIGTNIPPFWLPGIADAIGLAAENPKSSDAEILDTLGPPDFPSGGRLIDPQEVRRSLETGRGVVRIAGRSEISPAADGAGQSLAIVELPYGMGSDELLDDLQSAMKIAGVKKVHDVTTYKQMRVELLLTKTADVKAIIDVVESLPSMTASIPIDVTVIDHGHPTPMSIADLVRREADQWLKSYGGSLTAIATDLESLRSLDPNPRRTS